jgi:Flp pilus assembly protein TadG
MWWRRILSDERGSVLVMVALSMSALLGMAGLAIDSSRAYLMRAQLSRAVDAAALAGARSIRQGEDLARQQAVALAHANGVADGDGSTLTVDFGTQEDGSGTVTVRAESTIETFFMRVFGREFVTVSSVAVAIVPPLDIVLVLDTSGSLANAGAWDDLQAAADDFVQFFHEDIDQMGLVSFQVRGANRYWMDHPFKSQVRNEIYDMNSAGDTNPGEGLRLALQQLEGGSSRENAVRVVVFFTDGRPTAFRGPVFGQDRIMAVYAQTWPNIRGYFNNPDNLNPDQSASPNGCKDVPSCAPWTEPNVRQKAGAYGLQWADAVREEGIFIFAITLGDPTQTDPLKVPDHDYSRAIANEEGMTDSGQPHGRAYFSPSKAELREVFQNVAKDIVVRLTK